MRKFLIGASMAAISAGAASAGGIDRTGMAIDPLFQKGGYAELTFGSVNPSVSGHDVAIFGGQPTGGVVGNYTQFSFAYKNDINDKLSYAIILDQPFGADLAYGPSSIALGGTKVKAETMAGTFLMRYKFNENFSVHGGVRADNASGEITLKGAAYGPFSGYNVRLDQDLAWGYVIGAAYERPDIALRVALTYNSEITHNFGTVETLNGAPLGLPSVTKVSTPKSVNLDFQTGVAADTLVFGQIRWAEWSAFQIDPKVFTPLAGGGLISLEDTTTWTLGVGHKFTENWSGAVSVSYEKKGNPLVSPLAPTNGRTGVSLAAIYTKDNMKITTGVNYTKLGDAMPETGTPDVARANFTGNKVVGVGVKIGYSF